MEPLAPGGGGSRPGGASEASRSDRPEPALHPLAENGRLSLDLAGPGPWSLRAEAPGWWSAPQLVEARDVRATGSLDLELVPAGRIEAEPRLGEGGSASNQPIEVRFELVAGGARKAFSGIERCELRRRDGEEAAAEAAGEGSPWSCVLPAGRWDLRLKIADRVPVYRWEVTVEPGEATSLGRLVFRRGASLVGRVERSDGEPPSEECQVRLAPERAARPGDPGTDRRLERVAQEGAPDARGFFQIAGVAPGLYRLRVEEPGFAEVEVGPLEIRDGLEAQLPEPLVLQPPATLEVTVRPPVSPFGRPWRLTLFPRGGGGEGLGGESDDTGFVRWHGLDPGIYRLFVEETATDRETALGVRADRWASRDVEVLAGPNHLDLALDAVMVRGGVVRGDEPVAGTVYFGGRHGERRVSARSDEEGRFSALLPESGTWPVEVEVLDPRAVLVAEPVEVEAVDGVAEVEIVLPDTSVAGVVVAPRGDPVAGARVTAASERLRRGGTRTAADGEGRFELRGLPEGTALLSASDAAGRSSRAVAVELVEGRAPPEVRLELEERRTLRGRVVSPHGGVAGARVVLLPAVPAHGAFGGGLEVAVSGPDGGFEIEVADSTVHLDGFVVAPGYSTPVLRLDARSGELRIAVEEAGGRLVLPPGAGGYLLSGGAAFPLALLLRFLPNAAAEGDEAEGDEAVRIDGMAPDSYALCGGPRPPAGGHGPACASGFLPPFGELRLEPPAEP